MIFSMQTTTEFAAFVHLFIKSDYLQSELKEIDFFWKMSKKEKLSEVMMQESKE